MPGSIASGAGVSSSDIDDLTKRIKDLENIVKDKVDCDTFDNEIMAIREMIGNMEPTEENKLAPVATTVVAAATPKERGP
jgi:hypothetical protein